jgi:hypothetical protein
MRRSLTTDNSRLIGDIYNAQNSNSGGSDTYAFRPLPDRLVCDGELKQFVAIRILVFLPEAKLHYWPSCPAHKIPLFWILSEVPIFCITVEGWKVRNIWSGQKWAHFFGQFLSSETAAVCGEISCLSPETARFRSWCLVARLYDWVCEDWMLYELKPETVGFVWFTDLRITSWKHSHNFNTPVILTFCNKFKEANGCLKFYGSGSFIIPYLLCCLMYILYTGRFGILCRIDDFSKKWTGF